jgi:hypothetical protein
MLLPHLREGVFQGPTLLDPDVIDGHLGNSVDCKLKVTSSMVGSAVACARAARPQLPDPDDLAEDIRDRFARLDVGKSTLARTG